MSEASMPTPRRRPGAARRSAPTIPIATHRLINDWLAKGYCVDIRHDGSVSIKPPGQEADAFDRIDFS